MQAANLANEEVVHMVTSFKRVQKLNWNGIVRMSGQLEGKLHVWTRVDLKFDL